MGSATISSVPKDLKLLVTGSNPCGGERNPVSRGISK